MRTHLITTFLCALLITACSKTPEPGPIPNPVAQSFSVSGKSIKVDGVIKAGSKVGVEQAKSAVETAISILEK